MLSVPSIAISISTGIATPGAALAAGEPCAPVRKAAANPAARRASSQAFTAVRRTSFRRRLTCLADTCTPPSICPSSSLTVFLDLLVFLHTELLSTPQNRHYTAACEFVTGRHPPILRYRGCPDPRARNICVHDLEASVNVNRRAR